MSKAGLIAKLKIIFNDTTLSSMDDKATEMGGDIWDEVAGANYEYGSVIVIAGGGDVTIPLGLDWSNGVLFLYRTDTSTEYLHDGGGSAMYFTTYDALTNAGYTTDQVIGIANIPAINVFNKGTFGGSPKSATTSSFTLHDDGVTTFHMKYVVIA